jgi:hypothetical protein
MNRLRTRRAGEGERTRPVTRGRGMDERFLGRATGDAPARPAVVGVLLATGLPGAAHRPLAVIDLHALVGREDDCDVILPSPRVSRRHARVWAQGDRFGVEDLGSLNGTYVNRRRVTSPTVLADGDRLTLGDVELQFRLFPAGMAPAPRGREPGDLRHSRGVTTLMPPAAAPRPPEAGDDLRAAHLVAALLAALAGAVAGHVLGIGRAGAIVLAVVLPLAVAALLLRPAGPRRAMRVVVLAVLAAVLTGAGVTAVELREGHAVLPDVSSGGSFLTAAQVDRLLGRPSPPAGCGPEPSVAVASSVARTRVDLRVTGRCFGPGSSVDVLVGPTVLTSAHADRFGRVDTRVVVDPDLSCPLGNCSVAAHELQSLRYQEAQTDVASAG